MAAEIAPLTHSILIINYFGDVVFAVSGALTAARYRMDVIGFVVVGTITGIGGGTLRDLLLGRTVWWTQNPLEVVLCMVAALATFLVAGHRITTGRAWSGLTPSACRPLQSWAATHCSQLRCAFCHRDLYGRGHRDRRRRHSGCAHQHPAHDHERTTVCHRRAAGIPLPTPVCTTSEPRKSPQNWYRSQRHSPCGRQR